MKNMLQRLDVICIEILVANINRFSSAPQENRKLRFTKNLGEKFTQAIRSSSMEEYLDDKTYQFLFRNFDMKEFSISKSLCKKVKYFDFLNEKCLDRLEIELFRVIHLKNKFFIPTDSLIISEISENHFFNKSSAFFANVRVNRQLIMLNSLENQYDYFSEDLLLVLLENTSKDIEDIQVAFENRSETFIRKCMIVLNKRKKLKNLFVNLDKTIPNLLKVGHVRIRLTSKLLNTNRSPSLILHKGFNNSLRDCKDLTKLYLKLENNDDLKEIRNVFIFLKSLNLENLQEINATSFNVNNYGVYLMELIEKCPRLEKLSFACFSPIEFDFFETIVCVSSTLKELKLELFKIDRTKKIQNFEKFFCNSSLKEITFRKVFFLDNCLTRVLQNAKYLKDSLTFLKIDQCDIVREAIKYLPEVLRELNSLKSFYFRHWKIENGTLMAIFKSLASSSKTLEVIHIHREYRETRVSDCTNLLDLLHSCRHLKKLKLCLSVEHEQFLYIFSALQKFKHILEEIQFDFCWKRTFSDELIDFIVNAKNLKNVFGFSKREFKEKIKRLLRTTEQITLPKMNS